MKKLLSSVAALFCLTTSASALGPFVGYVQLSTYPATSAQAGFANISSMTVGNIQAKGPIIDVRAYGAKGDNSTDDIPAIQAALNAASSGTVVYAPAFTYKLNGSLTIPHNVFFLGDWRLGSQGGTIFNEIASTPVLTIQDTNTTQYEQTNNYIQGFHLEGGTDSLYIPNGCNVLTLRDMYMDSPTNDGMEMKGYNAGIFMRDVSFTNGNYGMYLTTSGVKADGVTLGTNMIFDRSNFYNVTFNGQNFDGIHIIMNSGSGSNDGFYDLAMISILQNGAVFGGGLSGLVLSNVNTEDNGNGNTLRAPTVSTTTVGSNLVVVSTWNLNVGSTCTIAGAGLNMTDWYPYITNVWTSSITVSATAPATAFNVEFTTAIYSDIVFNSAGGSNPKEITVLGGLIGSTQGLRYSIDGTNVTNLQAVSTNGASRPVYDPNSQVQILAHSGRLLIRGDYGNFVSSNTGRNGAITLSNGSVITVSSITISPGTYLLSGGIGLQGNTTSATTLDGIISTTNNSSVGSQYGISDFEVQPSTNLATSDSSVAIPGYIVTVTVQTTYYILAQCSFTSGTAKGYGSIQAVRLLL